MNEVTMKVVKDIVGKRIERLVAPDPIDVLAKPSFIILYFSLNIAYSEGIHCFYIVSCHTGVTSCCSLLCVCGSVPVDVRITSDSPGIDNIAGVGFTGEWGWYMPNIWDHSKENKLSSVLRADILGVHSDYELRRSIGL
ncbi:hypothetical protein L2E82_14113 [Cichorium intybus]|uniref:Uncharacterized protein n=1 Tax=Cichorium intybus TaxID=13427 RepID=A0ACB9EZK0_CICIN|nr:hypothetical protein L2E82_14113 [Cichorium intybus]